MRASILATGLFQSRLIRFMDHPAEWYEGCPEGRPMAVKIGHVEGEVDALALARAFGVEMRNPATHRIGRHPDYHAKVFAEALARCGFLSTPRHAGQSPMEVYRMLQVLSDAQFYLFYHLEE